MNAEKILFISNGYGEDTIATSIILKLRDRLAPDTILAFPLVGMGRAYTNIGIPVNSPTRNMPSGGLIPGNWVKNLWKDLTSGLGRLILDQITTLQSLKKNIRLVVAVGDTFPVLMAGLFTKKPIIFVGTAKSDYFYPYSELERVVLRRYCKFVFPRDEITAESLRKSGVKAKWLGNAMMDSMSILGERFGIPKETTIITLLPGSRDVAYEDFPIILKAVEKIGGKIDRKLAYLAHLADSIDVERIGEIAGKLGYRMAPTNNQEGIVGKLYKKNLEILLLKNRFGDAINEAFIVIGQAGTGNEQAVGLGKPVVAFESSGKTTLGWYRLRQKGLLGDSLSITRHDPEDIATEVVNIMNDTEKYEKMSKIGKERMGPPGGAEKMANAILEFLEQNS